MKVDFWQAVKELRRTRGLKIQDLYANLVSDIVNGIQEAIQPVLAQNNSSPSYSPLVSTTGFPENPSTATTVQLNSANTTTIDSL